MNLNFKYKPITQPSKKQKLGSWQIKILKASLIVSGLLIAALVGIIAIFTFIGQKEFDSSEVVLEIQGPEITQSGEKITYILKILNNSSENLENAQLNIKYAKGFISEKKQELIKLNSLVKQEAKQIEIKGTLIGSEFSEHAIEANLSFKPENFNSQFSIKQELKTQINSSTIFLSIDAPKTAAYGEKINLDFSYLNKFESIFDDFQVQIIYPENFTIQKTVPNVSVQEDNKDIFYVGALEKDKLSHIKIQGMFEKLNEDFEKQIQSFKTFIGIKKQDEFAIYNKREILIQLNNDLPIIISQIINEQIDYSARVGEILDYALVWENQTDMPIFDATITCTLQGDIFDLDTLEIENGTFDKYTKKITWNSSGISGLGQIMGQSKSAVNFSIKILDQLPIAQFDDKNFFIKTLARLKDKENLDISHELVTKINSNLNLETKAYYNEQSANIVNSGPLPPKVGEKTLYTIHWQLINGANDLKDVLVSAIMPDNVQYTGKKQLSSGKLYYDTSKNMLSWEIVQLSAHTGNLVPSQEAVFQVELIPTKSQVNHYALLLNNSMLSALDTFTEKNLNSQTLSINTSLPDDPGVARQEGLVRE